MIIVGGDPGIRGGFAIVVVNNGAVPRLIDAIDIPVTGVTAKERVDACVDVVPGSARLACPRKKDHGRAEAALIALAGAKHGL